MSTNLKELVGSNILVCSICDYEWADDNKQLRCPKCEEKDPFTCGGYWTHTLDGDEFDCEYEPDFTCENCIINGGDHDPRLEQPDDSE